MQWKKLNHHSFNVHELCNYFLENETSNFFPSLGQCRSPKSCAEAPWQLALPRVTELKLEEAPENKKKKTRQRSTVEFDVFSPSQSSEVFWTTCVLHLRYSVWFVQKISSSICNVYELSPKTVPGVLFAKKNGLYKCDATFNFFGASFSGPVPVSWPSSPSWWTSQQPQRLLTWNCPTWGR